MWAARSKWCRTLGASSIERLCYPRATAGSSGVRPALAASAMTPSGRALRITPHMNSAAFFFSRRGLDVRLDYQVMLVAARTIQTWTLHFLAVLARRRGSPCRRSLKHRALVGSPVTRLALRLATRLPIRSPAKLSFDSDAESLCSWNGSPRPKIASPSPKKASPKPTSRHLFLPYH